MYLCLSATKKFYQLANFKILSELSIRRVLLEISWGWGNGRGIRWPEITHQGHFDPFTRILHHLKEAGFIIKELDGIIILGYRF